jgi:ABC-type molybdate transport system substrate-binding protein
MQLLLLLLLFASFASAQTTELRVICSNVIKAAVERLLPAYQRESGQRVSVKYGASAELKRSLEAGESFDVALLTTGVIDDLSRRGIIAAASRAGEDELAFAPVTEIVAAPGAQVLGLFPPEFQRPLAPIEK